MKKFFGKKNVLVAFAVAAVIFLGGLIAMLASPVFYAGAYKTKEEMGSTKLEASMSFKSGNKVETVQVMTVGDKVEEDKAEMWYYKRGNHIKILGSTEDITKEQYNKLVEQYDKLSDDAFEKVSYEISFNKIEFGYDTITYTYENKLAVAFVVIDAVLLALALAGTGLAVFYSKKGKKAKA